MEEIFLATGNRNKIEEFKALVSDLNITVKSILDGIIIPEVEETEKTFEGNSQKKALEISNFLNMIVISDDSGLCVDVLDGRPGVYSARYSGEYADDNKNIDKILEELKYYDDIEARKAKFVSVVSIAYPNGDVKSFRGEVDGYVLSERHGSNGFGYDPIFYSFDLEKSFGEATQSEKKSVSHRARAFLKLKKELCELM